MKCFLASLLKSAFLAILFFFFYIIAPKITHASVIHVTGFDSSRNPAPLAGFVPNEYFGEDPSVGLRDALLDSANFGPGGTVSCSVDFQPFVTNISSGSLVADGKKKADVFFAGLSRATLTNEEANELAAFVQSGGIVYISGNAYSQGVGIPGYEGSNFNPLFSSLGIADGFPAGEVVDFWPCGDSTKPIGTPVTTGPFGIVGPLAHDYFNPINTSSLQSVASGFGELCFIGMSFTSGGGPLAADSDPYFKTLLAEGKFGQGYLSVSGTMLYPYVELDEDRKNYFLNLFSLACPGGSEQPPTPFLDLPWDYEGKGLSFSEAATAIGSYFDHEYPFLDVGSVLSEPTFAKDSVVSFEGPPRDTELSYSGHDGYDWLKKAKVFDGDPVLAAAAGTATFYPAGKSNGACGTWACGNVITIDHGNGYQTRYYHLQDDNPISQSFSTPRFVNQGEVIGKVGSTGRSSAPHIHFSVVQDKDGDGNFQDNRPEGLTDPFGWQSPEPDPWPNYTFTYKEIERTGNKSFYLWTKPIANLSKELTSNGGYFRLERYETNFPENSAAEPATVNMKYSPTVTVSDSFESIGSSLYLNVIDASGNPITTFAEEFTLTIDFNDFDIGRYRTDSISIYSSEDGIAWVKEDTVIDWENKTATATLNHASYFALVAEKLDTLAPTTTAELSGTKGVDDWYRSDVEVALAAEDDEGGSGIYYIGYKTDDDYFKEYTGPFIVSDEGEHTIEFYAVDSDENVEELKSINFHIDKTPPEAKLQFSPDIKDVVVLGIDENDVEVTFEQSQRRFKYDQIIFEDLAGNTLKLEGKFRLMDKSDSYSFETLHYNDGKNFKFEKNFYLVNFGLNNKTKGFTHVIQSWFEKGETRLAVIYNGRKDESEIFKKNPGEKLRRETIEGLTLLYIKTNSGNLEFGYE